MIDRQRLLGLALFISACSSPESGGLIDHGSCDALIACASELAPESRDEFIATYGDGGSCWVGGASQWAACRDACRQSLDALNLAGQISGQTCGTCETDGDCASFGAGASCDAGACVGGDSDGGSSSGGGSEGADTGDTDTGGCMALNEAPPICLIYVDCVGAIAPAEQAQTEAMYGAEGSCWCGSDAEAQTCYEHCLEQVAGARQQYPTVAACHEESCSLDDLDASAPYGPVTGGTCPSWNGNPQLPLEAPFGLPGSVCAPACEGLAQSCPSHPQTTAQGSCYLVANNVEYCASRCYVDSDFAGGAQCQCGATCQPHGAPDGEGQQRGICTFE